MTLRCKPVSHGRHPCFQFAHFGGHFFKVKIMSRYYDDKSREVKWGTIVLHVVFFFTALIALCMAGCPYYNVWSSNLSGKASLARATQDRQIAVQEALAKKESAKMLADAEIERAKGVAKANQIIGDSLRNNEEYLRYLWIDGLQQNKSQVIYVPTEANLPILEAGKRE
ncbi:hypothetical protein SPN9TCW_003 [Salmonella phage SPN9TCW]|nr:hypothetical protein SPN9TCW_003 [Salmonella phage SPN9TCW]